MRESSRSAERDTSPHTPPGWDYNPSTWGPRLPIVVLALVGFGIATYLALYQVGVVKTVWEPFFGRGSDRILHSWVSKVLPVSDAALGAFSYLLDAVTGVIGRRDPVPEGGEEARTAGVACVLGTLATVRARRDGRGDVVIALLSSAAVGLWVMSAPTALGYSGTQAATLAWLLGPLIVTFAWVALWECVRAVRWMNVPLGVALAIGGLVVATSATDAVNHVACGVLVALLSIPRGRIEHSFAGGWRALVSG